MRSLAALSLVLVVLLTPDLASADILLPGRKRVEHRLVLVDSPALEGWKLFAAPSAGFGGVAPIAVGEPFDFSRKYGTRIYAVPPGEPLPEEWSFDTEPAPGWIAADVPVQEVESAPVGHPLAEVLTTLRVESIDERAGIDFSILEERRFAADGSPVVERWRTFLLAALGGVGVAGLLVLRRRRDRAAAPGPSAVEGR